jgi:hypothetical protein
VLQPLPKVAPRRNVVVFDGKEVASHVARDAQRRRRDLATTQRILRRGRATTRGSRERVARTWALVLCGLVAMTSAGASFLASPMGRKPSVVRALVKVEAAGARARHVARHVAQEAYATVVFVVRP